jgi:D-alanyl-D-alanine carboxypeptidase (penicillin-binding protein 5/6)
MSAHIQDLSDRRIKVTGGEANTPHGRFPAMRSMLFAILAVFVFTIFPHTVRARQMAPQGEDAVASYLVKETGRPEILQAKEIDKPLSPASLTKVMTCLLAIESGRMDDVVSIPLEATQVEPTRAGFKPGERVRLRDLVKAAMVNSSNDAAFAIGIHLGGSIDSFVATMNSRARALGMNHTWFTNPAGYDRRIYAGNRSTARDMMILTERAVRYSEFNAIARLDRAVISELSTGKTYSLSTHNRLLQRYPYTVGIKTGYTSIAGPCLIARAVKDGKDMLIVMLGARTNRWSLASGMFDRGFGIEPDMAVQVAEAAPESYRGAAVIASAVPASGVLAERTRALNALSRKVERQGQSAKVEEIRGISRSGRSAAKSSVRAKRLEKSKLRAAVKSRSKAGQNRKMALKGGKKVKVRKEMVVKTRQHSLRNKTALKRAKKSAGEKVAALKARNKKSQAVRTARKGATSRATAQMKKEKKSAGKKEALSLSKKSHRSPNG